MGIECAWGVAETCMGGQKQVGWGCDGQSVGWNMRTHTEHAWGERGQNGMQGGHEWVMWVSEPRDQKMTKLVQRYGKKVNKRSIPLPLLLLPPFWWLKVSYLHNCQ